jgi:DNA-binding NtrC family response regulator
VSRGELEAMSSQGTILVVDDEEIMREVLEALLTREGYRVKLAATGHEGLDLARAMPFDAAIVDVMMPGIDGITTLEELKKIDDDLPVLMITAFASVEHAIVAMKRGALDYITKPFKNDEVLVVLENAVERRRLVTENRALKQNLQARYSKFANIVGRSPKMRQVFDLVIQAAPSRSTVLVYGESGTGKELVARALHTNSTRADRAFVTVNSGSLPPDLLESNLFGHVKGAFTGAVYPKKGLFELADKGSIFFDEIGNVPLETQSKLLRVIQEREFMRLGGVETIRVDVRIIAATNVDLRRMMEEGKFREDLYYRLHVITVTLPPLRERKEDIPLLAQHFLSKYGEENAKTGLELTPDVLDVLMDYDWPGNVRELENVVERAVVLCPGTRIDVDLIPDHVRNVRPFQIPQIVVPPEGISFKQVIGDFEKRLIETTLEAAGGVQKRAAELLHIKPTTLNEMIKRYDIRPRRKKALTNGGDESARSSPAQAPAAPAGEPEPEPASTAVAGRR